MAAATVLLVGAPDTAKAEIVGIEGYYEEFLPMLEKHCLECHGREKVKGDVDFTKLTNRSQILGQDDLWRRVREAIEFEDMPPRPGKTGFTPDDGERMIAYVRNRLESVDLTSEEFRHPGPSFIRQLTAYEYMRTMRDLVRMEDIPFGRLGIEQSYPKEGHQFVNQALGLAFTHEQFDRYLRTGEEILKQLFGDETGAWRRTGNAHRKYRNAAEEALPEIVFARPADKGEEGPTTGEAARQVLERFATRAFRRPVREAETEGLLGIFRESMAREGTYDESLMAAMSAVLASPHFLLRTESNQAPAGSDEVYPITGTELATRLSYFLWSSMPDDRLRELGASGELLQEDVLLTEVDRMLEDERAGALTEHFAYQWLQLKLMGLPSLPTRKGFPDLTDDLERAFRREMEVFFDHLRTEDHPITDLLQSDYTYVTRELAEFYGIEDPALKKIKKSGRNDDPELVRVALKPEHHRGGVLGMGGFLWMTSHESRTMPTHRGLWILEVVLGTPPPPPPPEAGAFAAPEEGAPEPKNFREKLEMHASDESCAGCHARIDPLGFALENFDAIGAWRTEENGDPVDNAGELPTGEKFTGFAELREVILSRKDRFTRNFVTQLLQYALGREALPTDRGTIELIARDVEENDHRFSKVIEGIVMSRAFRHRTNLESVFDTDSLHASADADPGASRK